MDSTDILYNYNSDKKIVTESSSINTLRKLATNSYTVAFAPFSGWNGDSIVEPRANSKAVDASYLKLPIKMAVSLEQGS